MSGQPCIQSQRQASIAHSLAAEARDLRISFFSFLAAKLRDGEGIGAKSAGQSPEDDKAGRKISSSNGRNGHEEESGGAGGEGSHDKKRARRLGLLLDARVTTLVSAIRAQIDAQNSTLETNTSRFCEDAYAEVRRGVGLLLRLEQVQHAHDLFLAPRTVAVTEAVAECRVCLGISLPVFTSISASASVSLFVFVPVFSLLSLPVFMPVRWYRRLAKRVRAHLPPTSTQVSN